MTKINFEKINKGQLVTVVGNRPQFIKMTAVNRELERRKLSQVVLHTGQHYDHQMNQIFFDELSISKPDLQLSVSSASHGAMTGELLAKIEQVFMAIKPSGVLIYGDTNSTLAAALAAVKLGIPVAHVESGPRLGNLETPEEVNRIIADHLSTLRFASDAPSVDSLRREGITKGVINTGDVMYDVFLTYASALANSSRAGNFSFKNTTVYVTLHRPQNVDDRDAHLKIIDFISRSEANVIFPLHPRTQARIKDFGLMENYRALPNLFLSGPLGYLDSIAALLKSDYVITDSGGLQKEAYFAGKLAMLMLPKTPWPELHNSGWLTLGGWVRDGGMLDGFLALRSAKKPALAPEIFGAGNAAKLIVNALVEHGFVREYL